MTVIKSSCVAFRAIIGLEEYREPESRDFAGIGGQVGEGAHIVLNTQPICTHCLNLNPVH